MDWIFSYNESDFNLDDAIHDLKVLDWSCKVNVEIGDRVYLYASAPTQAIKYRCTVEKVGKTHTTIDDSKYKGNPPGTPIECCELKLELEFEEPGIPYEELLKHGLKPGTLTKRKITDTELLNYLNEYASDENHLRNLDEYVPTGDRLYWLISLGRDSYMWDVFKKEGIAAINWHTSEIGDARQYNSIDDIPSEGLSYTDLRCIDDFCNGVRPGDIIFVRRGVHSLIAVGVVTEPYYYVESDEYFKYDLDEEHKGNYRHRIGVKWLIEKEVQIKGVLSRNTFVEVYNPSKIRNYLGKFDLKANSIPTEDDIYIHEIHEIEEEEKHLEGEEKQALVEVRVNQSVFKKKLMKKYHCRCAICGMTEERLLIASHIKPWAECDRSEQLDTPNGLLLCPNHDKLFDLGFISFDDSGKIIISNELSSDNRNRLNISGDESINVSEFNILVEHDEKQKEYLEYHREHIFRK